MWRKPHTTWARRAHVVPGTMGHGVARENEKEGELAHTLFFAARFISGESRTLDNREVIIRYGLV